MKRLLTFILLGILYFQVEAQESQLFEFDHTINSEAFGDERKITVYLPPSYYENPDEKFTVTYILDGHFDPFIDLGVKTIEYNTYMHKYTPTIVVGIHAKQRGWEFSAKIDDLDMEEGEEYSYKGGRATELQKHFRDEVFPLVDSLYDKTLPFRSIVGHSSGGGFVLYSIFSEESDLFDGYIAISPALRPGEDNILERASMRLAKGDRFNKFLYCSSGTLGEREELFGGAVNRLDSILQVYPDHGLIWHKAKFEDTGHWTCVGPSFNDAMVKITRAFRVDEKRFFDFAKNKTQSLTSQIEEFYQTTNQNFGFIDIPSAGYIYGIGYEFWSKGDHQNALELYEWGIKQHPTNYTLNKQKSKQLARMGKNSEAIQAFQHCFTVLEGVKDKFEGNGYQEQIDYLNKRINDLKK